MKTNIAFGTKLRAASLGAALLVAATSISQAAPPLPPSPVFSNGVPAWDCLITGPKGERGIMFLTFTTNLDAYGNYRFGLQQIHTKVTASGTKVPVTTTNAPDPRGGTIAGRGNESGGVSNVMNLATTGAGTNIYGYLATSGAWGYDYKGNILGFYIELIIDTVSATNITYVTNQVSFIGKVTPNKRFTALYSSTMGGNGKYAGVPLKAVTNQVNGADFSGPWTGDEIIGSVDTVELFSLLPSGFTNAYNIAGDGPGYSLNWGPVGPEGPRFGKCLVSTQKKIAIANHKYTNPTNAVASTRRVTYGELKNSTLVAGSKTKGLIEPGSNVVYNAFFVPFAPYP